MRNRRERYRTDFRNEYPPDVFVTWNMLGWKDDHYIYTAVGCCDGVDIQVADDAPSHAPAEEFGHYFGIYPADYEGDDNELMCKSGDGWKTRHDQVDMANNE